MSVLNLCTNDPLLKILRETFNANPVRVPETRLNPLSVILKNDDHYKFIGGLESLLEAGAPLTIDIQNSRLANVSASRTKTVDIGLGMEILSGFLSGMGVDSGAVKGSFQGATKVSFSFQNVNRNWIDIGVLGNKIGKRKFDKTNALVRKFLYEDFTLLLIDSVITSNNFTLNVEKKSSSDFKLDIEGIQGLMKSMGNNITATSNSDSQVSFNGDKSLAFAFSCIDLKHDQARQIAINTKVDNFFLDHNKETHIAEVKHYILSADNRMIDIETS